MSRTSGRPDERSCRGGKSPAGSAGFLAGKVMHGAGFGLIGDLIVGCIGALLGGWLLGLPGVHWAASSAL
jgi:uncharacterized membrane protein YeaQ/YmgE (transglycosylase-associated protein family)